MAGLQVQPGDLQAARARSGAVMRRCCCWLAALFRRAVVEAPARVPLCVAQSCSCDQPAGSRGRLVSFTRKTRHSPLVRLFPFLLIITLSRRASSFIVVLLAHTHCAVKAQLTVRGFPPRTPDISRVPWSGIHVVATKGLGHDRLAALQCVQLPLGALLRLR